MLIVFANTKGGVGKSTLSSHLVIWLHDLGYKVGLIDTDPQETSARWVRAAEPKILVKVVHDMDAIRAAKKELEAVVDIIVADSPGEEGDASRTITLLADMAVVPLQPSMPDVRAVKDALKTVRLAQELSGGKSPELTLVITLTARSDVQTRRLREQLEAMHLPVAKAEVRRLNAIRDACDGAVTRISSREAREASKDLAALFMELMGTKLEAISKQETHFEKRVAND